MIKVNLGCGNRFITEWINIDFVSNHPKVIQHDLRKGIPLESGSVDVTYHSHVLEHFTKKQGEEFLYECYRVLRPNGVIRIAVPDLEQIARLYLQQLESVKNDPNPLTQANYEWSVIEMYDQTIRNYSGGEMANYWSQPVIINENWLNQRVGGEFLSFRNSIKNRNYDINSKKPKSITSKLKMYFKRSTVRDYILTMLSGEPKFIELLELARFRTGGEIHQWMYDSYSLGELLNRIGFKDIRKVDAFNSSINNWPANQWLDVEEGKVRKPDSLFLEARK